MSNEPQKTANLHTAGKHIARVVDSAIWKSEKGNPVAVLMFEYKDQNANPHQIAWFGHLAGGAREITVDTLVRVGFKSNDLSDLNLGKECLDFEKDYEIVIANEPNPNKGNQLMSRVKWVNLPGGSGFRERMSKEDAVTLCKGFDLRGDFMAARQKAGKPANAAAKPQQAAPSALPPSMSEEELGF